MNLLAGLDVPSSGSVRVFGVPLPRHVHRLAAHRRRVGSVLQSKNLIDHLSARGNLAVPLALHGMPWREAQAKAEHWLDALGLSACRGASRASSRVGSSSASRSPRRWRPTCA